MQDEIEHDPKDAILISTLVIKRPKIMALLYWIAGAFGRPVWMTNLIYDCTTEIVNEK